MGRKIFSFLFVILAGLLLGVGLYHWANISEMPTFPGAKIDDGLVAGGVPELEQPELYYWYQTLGEKEQAVYREIFYEIQELQESVHISYSGSITDIINYIKLDHPEVFWFKEAEIAIMEYTGWKELIINYRTDQETILEQQQHIEAMIDSVLSGVSEDASMYEKVKYVYDSILSMTEYEKSSEYNQDIRSVFLKRKRGMRYESRDYGKSFECKILS